MNPKYAALMEHFGVNRKELFHNLYIEFENYYPDIDLNQELQDYCAANNFTTCCTMDVITNNETLRQLFENMVNGILAENNIKVEPEMSFTATIFSHGA